MARVGRLLSGVPNRAAEWLHTGLKPKEGGDWGILASLPVSAADKEQIRIAAFSRRLSFQELVIGAVRRRLVGRPPIVRIERVAGSVADSSVSCNFTQSEKMRIASAARALGVTIHDYLRDAIFGEYAPEADVPKLPAPKPEPKPTEKPPGLFRIGVGEKRRIERAALFWNLSFDEYVTEAVGRRLAGRPPMQRIPRSLFPDRLTEAVCRTANIKRVYAAADAAHIPAEEYLAGAVFGDYRFRRRKRKSAVRKEDGDSASVTAAEQDIEPDTDRGTVRKPDRDSETEPKKEPERTEMNAGGEPAGTGPETGDGDRAFFDFAHSDYTEMFRRVVQHDTTLEPFVKEIETIAPPQYGEFMNVIRQARSGDQKARNRAAEMYLRVAVRTAYRNATKYDFDLGDSISDACLGLLTEIDRFRFRPGKRTFSGAVWRMDSAVIRANASCHAGIRFPVHLNDLYYKSYPFLKESGFLSTPSPAKTHSEWAEFYRQLIASAGADQSQSGPLLQRAKPVEPVESLVPQIKEMPEDEDNPDYVEFDDSEVPSKEEEPADLMAEQETYRFVRQLLHRLDAREQEVILLRYGIADGITFTLEEIGFLFGITRERVRQLECRAMKKIRRFIEEAGIRAEDYL